MKFKKIYTDFMINHKCSMIDAVILSEDLVSLSVLEIYICLENTDQGSVIYFV